MLHLGNEEIICACVMYPSQDSITLSEYVDMLVADARAGVGTLNMMYCIHALYLLHEICIPDYCLTIKENIITTACNEVIVLPTISLSRCPASSSSPLGHAGRHLPLLSPPAKAFAQVLCAASARLPATCGEAASGRVWLQVRNHRTHGLEVY